MCYNDSTSFGKKDLKEKGENWAQKKKKKKQQLVSAFGKKQWNRDPWVRFRW